MKKLKIPIEKLKPFWEEMLVAKRIFRKSIAEIEAKMQKQFKCKDSEFVRGDGEVVGIGTPYKPEKMDMIHEHTL